LFVFGGRDDKQLSNEQKDGASDNTPRDISSIDAVSDSLGRVAISNDDDNLFKDPPPKEDCPICMLPIPFTTGLCGVRKTYQPCCGMTLCYGCTVAADEEIKKGNMKKWCPFCRIPYPNSEKETVKRIKKRMKLNDALAFLDLGMQYRDGHMGLPQDREKAFELWIKAAELGSCGAHSCLASAYYKGEGVEEDVLKGAHHMMLAAIGGREHARYVLGIIEEASGKMNRAMKHYMIAAKCGHGDSLTRVGKGYKSGHVTKDDYANTLRTYQNIINEMKSEQRTKAALVVNCGRAKLE